LLLLLKTKEMMNEGKGRRAWRMRKGRKNTHGIA
jgi:hypothetical protein